jgi:hypothetical protein
MSTPTNTPPPRPIDCYEAFRCQEPELALWRLVEPVLAECDSLTTLRLHLCSAASSRRPDRLLTAMGRLAEADEIGNLAELIYADSFHPQLDQLARAVAWRDGRPYENAYYVATTVLKMVALEATARRQQHCGKAIMSRTWGRTFVISPRGPWRHRIEAEALAAWGRLGACVTAWRDSLGGQGVSERVTSRLAPDGDLWELLTEDDEVVADFEARCHEMRIPLRLAEKGLADFIARRHDFDTVLESEVRVLLEAKQMLADHVAKAEGS